MFRRFATCPAWVFSVAKVVGVPPYHNVSSLFFKGLMSITIWTGWNRRPANLEAYPLRGVLCNLIWSRCLLHLLYLLHFLRSLAAGPAWIISDTEVVGVPAYPRY
jgi:hypothetical protein